MLRSLSACALLLACAGVAHAGAAEGLSVPQLRGKEDAAARALLKDMGLKVRVIEVAGLPVGRVASQLPAAGAPVARGALITVRVGTRTRVQTTMPDVTGQPAEQAVEALTVAYDVHVQRTPGPAREAGHVLRTEPPAGTQIWLRGKVMLFVASGERAMPPAEEDAPTPVPTPVPVPTPTPTPAPDDDASEDAAAAPVPTPGTTVQLPDFTDVDLAEARAALKRLGLTINVVRVLDDDAKPNAVVMQVPGGPSKIQAGDTVWLRVAHAAPEPPEDADPNSPPAPTGPVVKMPTLVGMDVLQASQDIVRRGLLPHPWFVARAGTKDWHVVGQKDAPDTELPRGAIAHFRVALPVDRTGTVSMPYLFGLTPTQAASVLRGLALPTQGRILDAAGRVTLQVPQAGAQIAWGTPVTITVGKVTDTDQAAATQLVVMVPPGTPLPPPPAAAPRKKKNVLDKVGDFFGDLFD